MRTFVCQDCGKAHAVLYGAKIICGCGATSSAEIIRSPAPPEQQRTAQPCTNRSNEHG